MHLLFAWRHLCTLGFRRGLPGSNESGRTNFRLEIWEGAPVLLCAGSVAEFFAASEIIFSLRSSIASAAAGKVTQSFLPLSLASLDEMIDFTVTPLNVHSETAMLRKTKFFVRSRIHRCEFLGICIHHEQQPCLSINVCLCSPGRHNPDAQ
jgi:hypothetical protein